MKYSIEGSTLSGIADAIREKRGSTGKMLPTEFEGEILAIETKQPDYDGSVSIVTTEPETPEQVESIVGTWLLEDNIPLAEEYIWGTISVRFRSRGVVYSSLSFNTDITKYIMYDSTAVYNGDESFAAVSWAEQGYRYIEILSDIDEVDYPGALLEFLKKYGEKIKDPIYNKKFNFLGKFPESGSAKLTQIRFPFLYQYDTTLLNLYAANSIEFKDGGIESYNEIYVGYGPGYIYYNGEVKNSAYRNGVSGRQWLQQARSIYVKCKITDIENGYTVYQVLQKNATEGSYSREIINFSIDGVSYPGTSVMTFKEWCESPYNTIGATCSGFEEKIVVGNKSLSGVYGYYSVKSGANYTLVEDN